MKRNHHIVVCLTSTLLASALSAGAVGCLITGFELTVDHMTQVLQICFGVSFFASLLYLWKWGPLALTVLIGLAGGVLWFRGIPAEPFLSVITQISQVYHRAYQWGYLYLAPAGAAADWPLAVLGSLIALSAARTGVRGKGTIFTALLSVLPLAACMVVTNTVPEERWLLCLLSALALLILSHGVRREDPIQGSRLVAMASLPVILAFGLLFRAFPQESYVNRSAEIQETLLSYAQRFPQLMENTLSEVTVELQGSNPKTVDLKSLGARSDYAYTVMEVTADTGGVLYLRGQDYDSYTGTGWSSSPHRAEPLLCDGNLAGTVTVRTRAKKDLLYLPYYPQQGVTLTGGSLTNSEGLREYSFTRIRLPDNWQQRLEQNSTADTGIHATQEILSAEIQAFGSTAERLRYVTLPGETDVQAKEILESILPEGDSRAEQAEAIAEYVRNSAVYDLNTGRMPAEEEDFALWFLTESDTGYCVHFATAAVMLLRAADIPARYVTGYMVQTQPGQTTKVTAGNAHAWAEYYVSALGTWVVLEATPADLSDPESVTESAVTEPSGEVPETQPDATLPQNTLPEDSTPTVLPTDPPAENRSGKIFRLWWLLLPGLMALIPAQGRLRLTLRRRRLQRGEPNRQALARWQEVQLVAKLLKEEAPADLYQLAQKAKFSQHTLTSGELLQFDGYLNTGRRRLRKKPWYLQPLYRWFWAVY